MSHVDRSEDEQRRILLTTSAWIPLDGPLVGEGGGARVFRVVNLSVRDRFAEQIATSFGDLDRAKKNATQLATLLREIIDGNEALIAAGKVAKRADPRLGREIEILRDVQHPNLIRMLDHDRSDPPNWYVMPVMRGGVLKGKKTFTGNLTVVVRGMLDVARALEALHTHAKPIVHRDIKPGNIFVADDQHWILGDPGVAYRDDDRDETETRPVSKDWAPTWYGEELAQTPKADLFMLGKTALSLLVGGDKPLDPTFVKKPRFNLPELFPDAPGVNELYKLICSLVVSEPDGMPFDSAADLVPNLESLVPVVDNSAVWQLRQEVEALKKALRAPRLVLSYVNSNTNAVNGDHPGFKELMLEIPQHCSRLVFWARGHGAQTWDALLHVDNNVVADLDGIDSQGPNVMQLPEEARGNLARLTITNKSGMLYSLMVYAEE